MKTVEQSDDEAFAGTSVREIKGELLEDDYNRAIALFAAQGMSEDEGWRTLIVSGLAFFEGKEELAHLNRPDLNPDLQQNLDNLLHRAMDLQAQYSVMKFKAFRFMQDSRVLQSNVAGLRGELVLTEGSIPRLREQANTLKAESERLVAENQGLRSQLGQLELPSVTNNQLPSPVPGGETQNPASASLLKRLLGRK